MAVSRGELLSISGSYDRRISEAGGQDGATGRRRPRRGIAMTAATTLATGIGAAPEIVLEALPAWAGPASFWTTDTTRPVRMRPRNSCEQDATN